MIFKFLQKFVTTLNFFRSNIIKFFIKFGHKFGTVVFNIFLLDVNFDKSTI